MDGKGQAWGPGSTKRVTKKANVTAMFRLVKSPLGMPPECPLELTGHTLGGRSAQQRLSPLLKGLSECYSSSSLSLFQCIYIQIDEPEVGSCCNSCRTDLDVILKVTPPGKTCRPKSPKTLGMVRAPSRKYRGDNCPEVIGQ